MKDYFILFVVVLGVALYLYVLRVGGRLLGEMLDEMEPEPYLPPPPPPPPDALALIGGRGGLHSNVNPPPKYPRPAAPPMPPKPSKSDFHDQPKATP